MTPGKTKKKFKKWLIVTAWEGKTETGKLHQAIQLKGQVIILKNILLLIFFLRFIE